MSPGDREPGAMPAGPALERLAAIMARLRDPETGCPWDVAQDFATIAPYTIEEAYEVADAIDRAEIVFHARMAEEAGHFALADVVDGIAAKMVRRHPHVFADTARPDDATERSGWEAIKAEERSRRDQKGALAGVALGLPALLRAEKLQKRAARTGFDWPDAAGPRDKIGEEIAEVETASDATARAEEIGDLLFAVVNWARHLGIDPEAALRAANVKFERRFAAMEAEAGDGFAALSLDAKEELWALVKTQEG